MAVEGETVSHYFILVIRKFFDFMSLFSQSVWFSFSFKQFSSSEFRICNIERRRVGAIGVLLQTYPKESVIRSLY